MPRRHSRREAIVLTFSRATLWVAAMGACVLVLGFGLGGYSLGRDTNASTSGQSSANKLAAAGRPAVAKSDEVERPAAAPAGPVAPTPSAASGLPSQPVVEEPEPMVDEAPADEADAVPAGESSEPAVDEPLEGEATKVAEAPAPTPLDFQKPPRRGYGIQLGAFESDKEAREFAQTYREALQGLPVHIVAVRLKKRGTWYRVRVGKFSSKRKADKARKTLPAVLADASISVSYP